MWNLHEEAPTWRITAKTGLSRRAAVAAGAALSALATGAGIGIGIGPARDAAAAGAATERRQERRRKPIIWRGKFEGARVEQHPNGRDGEYLAHMTGGSGSGRCRRADKVREVHNGDLARCIERDSRDVSDGHIGAQVNDRNYRLLGHQWNDATGELQLHLHDEKQRERNAAASEPDGPTELLHGFDTYCGAGVCVCPSGYSCTFSSSLMCVAS